MLMDTTAISMKVIQAGVAPSITLQIGKPSEIAAIAAIRTEYAVEAL